MKTLEHLRELAYNAYRNVSFSPGRRAESTVNDYSDELDNDLAGMPEEHRERYKDGYVKRLSHWLSVHSRCFSTMITGSSGINVRAHTKANESEHKRYVEFTTWRDRALKAINRIENKKTAVDPLEDARARLASRIKNQEIMRQCNVIIRKTYQQPAVCVDLLVAAGLDKVTAFKILTPDYMGRRGYPSFALTNNNAEIHRLQQRIAELEQKGQALTTEKELPGGVRVVENTEDDRIQLFFPGKPEAEMISKLKGRGFRWSPRNGCWQRQLTDNARRDANYILTIK